MQPQSRPAGLLILITALAIIGPAGMDMYLPAIAQMPAALGTHAQKIQLTLSVFMLALGCGQLLIGPVADHWGRRPVMLLSLVLFVLASAGAAQSASVDWLIFWRTLQGFGACGAGLVAFAMVRDLYSAAERGRVYSLINAGIGIAPALAPILGGYLLLWGSWRLCFWVLLLFGAILLVLCTRQIKESCSKNQRTQGVLFWGAYRQLLRHPGYLSYAAAGLAAMGGLFTYFSLSPLLLVNRLGVSEQQFAFYFASNALVMMLTSLVAARIVSRCGVRMTVLLGMALMLAGGALMALLALYLPPCALALVVPMWLASAGVALTLGSAAAGALADFGHIAGSATALMSFVRLGGAALVGGCAIWWDSQSVWPLVWVLLLLAGVSGASVWRYCVALEAE